MDKKIILVLLILLVLAIYYCYTHESFTENFESGGVGTDTTTAITNLGNIAAQLLAGGNVTIPGNLTLNTNGQNIGIGVDSRNYFRITNNGNKELLVIGVGGSDMYFGATTQYGNNIVAGGSISAKGIANTGDISTSGKIIAGGRDILAEQDALKASIAALQASTIKDQDTIDLRNTKRFTPDGRLEYTAPGSGSSVFVANNSGPLSSENRADYYVSQFRISRNTK